MSCLNVATTSSAVRGGDIHWEDVHGASRVVSGLRGVGAWGRIEWQGQSVLSRNCVCARVIVMKPEGIFCQCELRTDNIFFFAMSAVLLCFYLYGFLVLALEKIWQRYFSVIFLSTSGR